MQSRWAFNSISESSVIIGPRYTQVGLDVSESVFVHFIDVTLVDENTISKLTGQCENAKYGTNASGGPSIDCGKLRQSCNASGATSWPNL